MQDQLQSDEWKPIIASALFYKKKLLIRRITGLALRALMFVAMAAVLFIALPILIPQQITMVDNYGVPHTNSMGWLIASYTGPVLVIAGTFVLDIWYLRNIRLLADRDAANIVGAPVFLAVLNKIAALDVEGYGKTHDRRGACFRYLHPIGQRIANLQTSSS